MILIAGAIAAIISIIYSGITLGNQVISGEIMPQAILIVRLVTSCLIYFGIWIYGIIDAAVRAQHISANGSGTENRPVKSKEGMIGLGVVLIAFGIMGLLLQFGLSFEFLLKYGWPLALLALGGYLIARSTGLIKGGQ